ncbi:hypothetical protein MC7420_7698 [Coleofasciculus chthonoplastes PCC 7420]|uniref:Uncharacterized protein n=1 Tax=Coleofasciculus chthonoplastes PCC 7420 TaxID=118168 RepID=B4VIF7_9CYAN|nr:hypothetical protein MC7420_7698 [Coleofasciculus chthonoplastes PCC 7420]
MLLEKKILKLDEPSRRPFTTPNYLLLQVNGELIRVLNLSCLRLRFITAINEQ